MMKFKGMTGTEACPTQKDPHPNPLPKGEGEEFFPPFTGGLRGGVKSNPQSNQFVNLLKISQKAPLAPLRIACASTELSL